MPSTPTGNGSVERRDRLIRAFSVKRAQVVDVEYQEQGIIRCLIRLRSHPEETEDEQNLQPALCYPHLTGEVIEGEQVLVNTTACDLGLGTGGFHFVVWTPRMACSSIQEGGHIMKLRYTPWQMKVKAVEEQDSPHHNSLQSRKSIEGMPVICCELHSQLLPVVAGIRSAMPGCRIVYIMTDGGALPLQFSRTVRKLAAMQWLSGTISAGHSFGGDREAVNVYSALAAARWVEDAHVAVVGIGPGVVGTGTALGHTGMQQAQAANAVASLYGKAVLPLRISRCDDRPRQQGISHHTRTVLTQGALDSVWAVMAKESCDDWGLWRQIYRHGLARKHRLVMEHSEPGISVLKAVGRPLLDMLRFMGRGLSLEPDYFMAAAAAGRWAATQLNSDMRRGCHAGN